MKAYAVFWKERIAGFADYKSSAVVIAESVKEALEISSTYGEVSSIHSENDLVITTKRPGTGGCMADLDPDGTATKEAKLG